METKQRRKPIRQVFFRLTMGSGVLPGRNTFHGSVFVKNETTEYTIKKKAEEMILKEPMTFGKDPEVTILEIREI